MTAESPSRRAIVNPERADVVEELSGRVDIEVDEAEQPDRIADATEAAVEEGVDLVAAVGGDGTQRSVAERVAGTDSALAVVPGGTVNLLGRVLGIGDVDEAAAAIEEGHVERIDLARCNGRPFLLNSSSGYDADVIDHVGDGAKRFGRVGYTAVGIRRLATARPGRCEVSLDGEPWFEGEALTVLVLNVGQRGSTRFWVAPDARPDDGRLDVVVVAGRRRSLLRAGWAWLRGHRPAPTDARAAQANEIEVRWADAVAVQRDGDADGHEQVLRYDVESGAVRVVVPDPDSRAGRDRRTGRRR